MKLRIKLMVSNCTTLTNTPFGDRQIVQVLYLYYSFSISFKEKKTRLLINYLKF